MAAVNGNKTQAARILGCDRRTVSRQARAASAVVNVGRDIPLRTMLRAVAVVGGAWLLLHLLPVVLVVIVSLFLVGTLGPAVEWLEARGVKRGWGIAVAFTAMALMTGGLLAITVPPLVDQVTNLVKQEPAIRDHLAAALAAGASAPRSPSRCAT